MDGIEPIGKSQPAVLATSPKTRGIPEEDLFSRAVSSGSITSIFSDPTLHHAEIDAALKDINARLSNSGRELDLSFDSLSGVLTVRVISKKTGEVLLEVPAEKLAVERGALFSGLGLLVDRRP